MNIALVLKRGVRISFNLCCSVESSQDSDGEDDDQRAKEKHKAWLQDFMEMCDVLNGSPDSTELTHHHIGEGRVDMQAIRRRMINSIRRSLLGSMPTRPAVSKWTKCGPVLDQMLFGFLFFNIVPRLLKLSFTKGVQYSFSSDDDAVFVQEMDWAEVAGVRSRRNRRPVNYSPNIRHMIVIVFTAPSLNIDPQGDLLLERFFLRIYV